MTATVRKYLKLPLEHGTLVELAQGLDRARRYLGDDARLTGVKLETESGLTLLLTQWEVTA